MRNEIVVVQQAFGFFRLNIYATLEQKKEVENHCALFLS